MTMIIKILAIATVMDLMDSMLVMAWFFLVGQGT